MSYLQQFNLVIKYNKGALNKIVDMLSRPPKILALGVVLQLQSFLLEEIKDQYEEEGDYRLVYVALKQGELNSECHRKDGVLYWHDKLCIPKGEARVQLMREAHISKVAGHFGVGKTLLNLQCYVHWPKMQVDVAKYVCGCVQCCTSKPTNWKLGLYSPLLVPSCPWKSISVDFVGGLPKTRHGHDYVYVVVDKFSKMEVFIPCKKTISGQETTNLFFRHVWVHFGLPTSIISDRDTQFLSHFWTALWGMMDTKLKRSTAFHPQTDGQTEVVNQTLVHFLRGYNQKHPKTWDESLPYIQRCYN
eukprot:Gb_18706 [translate_table: standard]